MTDAALLAHYERWFAEEPDPWNFETSEYELAKRRATLVACGEPRRSAILELGAANGVLAHDLTRLGERVVAVEGVASAAALARTRLADITGAQVVEGLIPDAVPQGPYDLVVASEILYYLSPEAYRVTLGAIADWLAPGGRLVAVHWRPAGPERPRTADDVHADLIGLPALAHLGGNGARDDYRLDVFERRT